MKRVRFAVPGAFEGRYERFERRQGIMIPTAAAVAWLLPEGRFEYWRGRPVEVAYA